jgi:hypothetical protein
MIYIDIILNFRQQSAYDVATIYDYKPRLN